MRDQRIASAISIARSIMLRPWLKQPSPQTGLILKVGLAGFMDRLKPFGPKTSGRPMVATLPGFLVLGQGWFFL